MVLNVPRGDSMSKVWEKRSTNDYLFAPYFTAKLRFFIIDFHGPAWKSQKYRLGELWIRKYQMLKTDLEVEVIQKIKIDKFKSISYDPLKEFFFVFTSEKIK